MTVSEGNNEASGICIALTCRGKSQIISDARDIGLPSIDHYTVRLKTNIRNSPTECHIYIQETVSRPQILKSSQIYNVGTVSYWAFLMSGVLHKHEGAEPQPNKSFLNFFKMQMKCCCVGGHLRDSQITKARLTFSAFIIRHSPSLAVITCFCVSKGTLCAF